VYTDGGLAPQVAWRALAAERNCSAAEARAWVRSVLEHQEIGALVAALAGVSGQGPRTLVMCNAVDDAYVAAAEAQHLFAVLAPTCAPGDAAHHWIAGGHVTSVLSRAHTFVDATVESFDLLDKRLAADEAAEVEAAAARAQQLARQEAQETQDDTQQEQQQEPQQQQQPQGELRGGEGIAAEEAADAAAVVQMAGSAAAAAEAAAATAARARL
jgi:hypothetical protein